MILFSGSANPALTRNLRHRGLSQQQDARDRHGVLEREALDFGRIDDAHFHEIHVFALRGKGSLSGPPGSAT